jgi:hypothetical protein
MRKMIITTAMLLAGTAYAVAQADPPGARTQDQRQNEEIGKPPTGDNPAAARAQGQLPQGQVPPASSRSGQRAADPSGQQSEKNNEEIGKPPK